MATGALLSTLIADVQLELGHTTNVLVGQSYRAHIAHRINREYERLYRDFTWPHLRRWVDLPTVIGQKLYTLPSVGAVPLTLADLREVYQKWGGLYTRVERGIEIEDYNAFNSDLAMKSDPILKWAPTLETQIELWPLPASVTSLRFLALVPFKPMVAETDPCLLDDQLITLYAAAELLARQSSKEAPAVAMRAQQHYATLKSRFQTGQNKVSLRGDKQHATPNDPRNKVFVGIQRFP